MKDKHRSLQRRYEEAVARYEEAEAELARLRASNPDAE